MENYEQEIEAMETAEEVPSQRCVDAIAKPNTCRRLQDRLNEKDEWNVDYNNYEDDAEVKNGNLVMYNGFKRLHKRCMMYCKQFPILRLESAKS
jgi:site-specific DNA-adenine methylase